MKIADDFGLRSLVIQKPFQAKKCYLYRAADSKNFLSSQHEEELHISPENMTSKAFVRATLPTFFMR